MTKSEKHDESDEIYYQYRHRQINPWILLLILVPGSIWVLCLIFQVFMGENINVFTIIGIILALCLATLLLLDSNNTMLIISSKGIEYSRSGYTIFAEWKDIKKVELRLRGRFEYVLVLNKSVVEANRINKLLLGITNSDVIIPLNQFIFNWHRTSLGELIQLHAPQIKLPNH